MLWQSLKPAFLSLTLCTFLSVRAAQGVELNLQPASQIRFEQAELGQTIGSLSPAWEGSGAQVIEIADAAGEGNNGSKVICVPGIKRMTGMSPEQILPESFKKASNGTRLYFSAWLLKNGGGGAISFLSNNVLSGYTFTLAGFGIAEGRHGYISYLSDSDHDGTPEMNNSSVIAKRNQWYEMVLAVDFNEQKPEESLGYLYYRELGQKEYTVVPEFDGVKLSWWSSGFNGTHFAYYRIDAARNNLQIDNLSTGIVTSKP